MSFASRKIRLYATVDGTSVDVAQCEFTYAINTMPSCSLLLAAGLRMPDGAISPANSIAQNLAKYPKSKLFVEVSPGASDAAQVVQPNGEFLAFEGYLSQSGSQISKATGLHLPGTIIHWLSDLTHGSCISSRSHPQNPVDFMFNASIAAPGNAAGGAAPGGPHYLPVTLAQTHITAASVQKDLWGEGIKPWFEELASQDRINLPQFGLNDDPDKTVQQALGRFDGDKLPVDTEGVEAADIARGIADDVAGSSLSPNNNNWYGIANVTLWDKLVGDLAPNFLFSVIPGPTWARVVPLTSGLRKPWLGDVQGELTFDNDSIEQADSGVVRNRPLGGCGLYAMFRSQAWGNAPGAEDNQRPTIGGAFLADPKGMIVLNRAPRWCNMAAMPGGVPFAVGVARKVVPVAAGAVKKAAPAPLPKDPKNLLDRLAQAIYVDRTLSQRTGRLVCPIRFDIAPGSTISVGGTGGKGTYFAMVVAVTYTFAAGPPGSASATYSLANIRTKKENDDPTTSVERHPIYNRVWSGARLIE